MKFKDTSKIKLENFDDLFVGYPVDIEKNLRNLLPKAKSLENKSIYLQIISQIALAQAMQGKIVIAHKTLDEAVENIKFADYLAKARIFLERGRVFHQSNNIKSALPFFKKSYLLCKKHKLDFHTANAAHMIAMVIHGNKNKIKWNKIAIDLVNKTQDLRAQAWLGVLYNNLAQNYLEEKQYKRSYSAFKESLKIAEKRGDIAIGLGVKCGIAKTLRLLNSPDAAYAILVDLKEEHINLAKKKLLPVEILTMIHGLIYEEFTELYFDKVKNYAAISYNDLSKDSWFVKLASKRLARMKKLSAQ